MNDTGNHSSNNRRQRTDRRKARLLPYFGKERRSVTIVREADVFEINIPPLKASMDRRNTP